MNNIIENYCRHDALAVKNAFCNVRTRFADKQIKAGDILDINGHFYEVLAVYPYSILTRLFGRMNNKCETFGIGDLILHGYLHQDINLPVEEEVPKRQKPRLKLKERHR